MPRFSDTVMAHFQDPSNPGLGHEGIRGFERWASPPEPLVVTQPRRSKQLLGHPPELGNEIANSEGEDASQAGGSRRGRASVQAPGIRGD